MKRFLWGVLVLGLSIASAHGDDIHRAVRRNDLTAVKAQLDADPSLARHVGNDRQTPLHEAAAYVTADMVELLLKYDPDVNAVAYNNFTPLHLAKNGRTAELLLRAGADPTMVDAWNETPLQSAAREGHKGVVDAILATGAQLDLVSALRLGRREEAKAIIAKFPGQARSPRKTMGMTLWGNASPLGLAAYQGDIEMMKLLVAAGADINDADNGPNMLGPVTPLSNAVWAGKGEAVRLLLELGASTNCAGGKYFGLITEYALARSSPEIFELLLAHGALKDENPFEGKLSLAKVAAEGDEKKLAIYLRFADKQAKEEGLQNALLAAAMRGQKEAVNSLIAAGAHADIFVWAAMGDLDGVKACVGADPSLVNAEDDTVGRTALVWAVAGRHHEVAKWLLEHGAPASRCTNPAKPGLQALMAPPDKFNLGRPAPLPVYPSYECPLLLALDLSVEWPDLEPKVDRTLVKKLIELGADVNVADQHGRTPLMYAASLGDVEIVRQLLERGADPKKQDVTKRAVIISGLKSREVTRLLLEAGADPNVLSPEGQNALDHAAQYGAAGVTEDLINAGAEVTLFGACVLGKEDAVRAHLAKHPEAVNIGLPGGVQLKPVVVAAQYGQVGVLGVLLEAGARLETDEHMVETPLFAAAKAGRVEAVRFLVDRGAKVDANSYSGTALHAAALYGHVDVARLLLERGASVDVPADGHGGSPLSAACFSSWSDNTAVAALLLDRGADPKQRRRDLATPLHAAAGSGAMSIVRLLLDRGADPNAIDDRGFTPLDEALRDGRFNTDEVNAKRKQVAEVLSPFTRKKDDPSSP